MTLPTRESACHPPGASRNIPLMFTGIVEETGIVENVRKSAHSIRLVLRAKVCARRLRKGDSVAVNGCCLTVVNPSTRSKHKLIHFDLLRETWERTNLRFARPGSLVNLERSLAANGRLGGHVIAAHPAVNVQKVAGIFARSPPIERMSLGSEPAGSACSIAWIKEPAARKRSALKNACVRR